MTHFLTRSLDISLSPSQLTNLLEFILKLWSRFRKIRSILCFGVHPKGPCFWNWSGLIYGEPACDELTVE
jgi:hypothetical protein